MSIQTKGGSRLPQMPTSTSAQGSEEADGPEQLLKQTPAQPKTPTKPGSSQMMQSMQSAKYSNGEIKKKKEEKFQQLSDGREMGNDGGASDTTASQKQPQSGRMQAMFLAAGGAHDKLSRIDRNERNEILLADMHEEEQLEENSEETMANKALQMGGGKTKGIVDLDAAAILTGAISLSNAKSSEVKQASKKQKINLSDTDADLISAENTFGFVESGAEEFLTPGGKEIKFYGDEAFEIRQPNGDIDEVEIRDNKVIIFDEYGDEVVKDIPLSLVLDDGTKLTIGPGGEVGITNRQLFAQVTNGAVQRNNRTTLEGGLREELVEMGYSEDEVDEKLEKAGNMIEKLVPDDINVDDLAQFNAADLDYLFRDGEYLVRDGEGAWTKDSVNASPAAKEAMREGRLMDTVWRMGGFCEEAETILLDFMDQVSSPAPQPIQPSV